MNGRALEMQLPLDDGEAGDLARKRLDHLHSVVGVEEDAIARLVRAFPSLRSIYAAREDDLARIVGAVAAARIRWFLDAPLSTALAGVQRTAAVRSMPHAA